MATLKNSVFIAMKLPETKILENGRLTINFQKTERNK